METKEYNSIFVPEERIDIANYITEILIKNYLVAFKKPIPNSPFWRKNITNNSENLKDLTDRYQLEIIGVKNLLKVFSPVVIIQYFTKSKRIGFNTYKRENREVILYDLFQEQIKYLKSLDKKETITISDDMLVSNNTTPVIKKFTNKKGKIAL